MDSKEILEGNKLIADFMGLKMGIDNYSYWPGCIEPIQERHLNYHASWGWIMPVIEKISRIPHPESEQLGERLDTFYPVTFGMISLNGKPMFRFFCCSLFEEDTLIEAAWKAVVDFIKRNNTLTNS